MNWYGQSQSQSPLSPRRKLAIGLVNNSSDRGLKVIEDHFTGVLRTAAGGREIDIRLFTCPAIRRASRPLGQGGDPYDDLGALFDQRLDAVVVTGMEPQARRLEDEPVYEALGRVADWAEERAVPVIWSCLAAHAAVLHLDGIARTRLGEKISGVFACDVVGAASGLMAGLPRQLLSPHSRTHGLPEAELAAHGYEILTRSDVVGPDIFLRHGSALSVFFQGHPEYEEDTLLLEYRRDIRRFLMGQRADYPATPQHYFDPGTEAALTRLKHETMRGAHDLARLDGLISLLGRAALSHSWREPAARLYANWLRRIGEDAADHGRPAQWGFSGPESRLR